MKRIHKVFDVGLLIKVLMISLVVCSLYSQRNLGGSGLLIPNNMHYGLLPLF